jgi:hypothetical protein
MTFLYPVLEPVRDIRQNLACYRKELSVEAEETDHSLGLLEWLDQTVQENAVEASISSANAMLVVLVEGVHGGLQSGEILRKLFHPRLPRARQGYQGRSPWLLVKISIQNRWPRIGGPQCQSMWPIQRYAKWRTPTNLGCLARWNCFPR